MEITEKNFKVQLPVVLKAIDDADFLSFDCEFTGLGEGAAMILPFDTPALVYHKAKTNLNNYVVLQFGLSAFNYDPADSRFVHRSFNFYVFPRLPKELEGRLRKKAAVYQSFSCQASSMEFLAQQRFDFNKWICEGVGFIKQSVIEELKRDLTQSFNWRQKSEKVAQSVIKIPDAHKANIQNFVKKFDEFYKTDENEHVIDNIQMFERRILTNILESKYGVGSLFFDLEIDINKIGRLKISKCDDQSAFKEMSRKKHEEKLALLDDAAGFCTIIKAISKSNKILIGHNIYLDLLHTLKAFCCDLPSNYEEFKELVNQWFPKLVDTKVLVSQPLLKKHFGFANSLNQIYERLSHAPFRNIVSTAASEEYSYKHCSENLHEAGYDAYLTGLIFIFLADFLAVNKSQSRLSSNCFDIAWDLISPMFNKLAPGRVLDMPCFDLALTAEADMVPDRSHVFHLSFSKDEWTNDHITQLFSIFGGVQVAWIDDNSCFVSLKDRKQTKMVQQNLIYRTDNQQKQWQLKPSIEYFIEQESSIGCRSKFSIQRKTNNEDSKRKEKSNDHQKSGSSINDRDDSNFSNLKNKETRMSAADNLNLKKMKLDCKK